MKKALVPFLFLTTLPIVLAGPFESIFDFLDSVVRDLLGGAVDLLQSNIYVAKLLITLIIVFIIQDEVKSAPFMRRGGEERAASNRISWMVAIVIGIIVFFGIPDQIVNGIFERDSMIFGMIIGALLIMFGRGESRFSYGLKAAGYWGLTYGLSGLVSQAFSPDSITGFLISAGGLITLISAIYWTWKVGQGLGPRVRMPAAEEVEAGAERLGRAARRGLGALRRAPGALRRGWRGAGEEGGGEGRIKPKEPERKKIEELKNAISVIESLKREFANKRKHNILNTNITPGKVQFITPGGIERSFKYLMSLLSLINKCESFIKSLREERLTNFINSLKNCVASYHNELGACIVANNIKKTRENIKNSRFDFIGVGRTISTLLDDIVGELNKVENQLITLAQQAQRA